MGGGSRVPSVFLTGASGFVGRHVARELARRGHRVVSLSRNAESARDLIRGDLLNPASYAAAVREADAVIHLAAVTGKAHPRDYVRANVDGTRALLDAVRAAGRPRFIFISSIAVTFPDTRGYFYAQSKAAAERLVEESGLTYTILRPTMVGGYGSPVFSGLARLAGLPVIPAFNGARARVQPIHVRDLAEMMVDVAVSGNHAGQVLEFGGRDILTLRELLVRIRDRMRRGPAKLIDVPVTPLLPALALAERVALSVVPFTVGQLATFRFDGVAKPNALWHSRAERFVGIDTILAESLPK